MIDKDPKLSDSLKEKLRAKVSEAQSAKAEDTKENTVPTFIVEEFMSIADGQV